MIDSPNSHNANQSADGGAIRIDAQYVIYRLEEAGRNLLSLPNTGPTTGLRMMRHDIVQSAVEAYGWTRVDARLRPRSPARRASPGWMKPWTGSRPFPATATCSGASSAAGRWSAPSPSVTCSLGGVWRSCWGPTTRRCSAGTRRLSTFSSPTFGLTGQQPSSGRPQLTSAARSPSQRRYRVCPVPSPLPGTGR